MGGSPYRNATESWNGTNWTTVNNLNTGRQDLGGSGASNTAVIAFGGQLPSGPTGLTESWNGTNWTETSDLNTARQYLAGCGTQGASVTFGGESPPNTAATEEFNSGPTTVTFTTS